ncbi:MAG TPA: class I SAM-dependent methyltransferase, partial [Rhodospirillales bacterium]|nr:class I SAM-dependent methyltransferase [Rhodospirillales bacterium]
MENYLSDNHRATFYKSHRERSSVVYKKKHRKQYDREFADLTQASSSMSVLEVGCGTGIFLRYLEACEYREIVGIDMDENLADVLEDLMRSEIYLDDVMTILKNKLKNRRFDRIVLLDVAEHLQLPVLLNLMKLLRSHINDDGRLLLRVPNVESPWGLRMFFGSFDHVTPLGPGRMFELGNMTGWSCDGCFSQEPGRILRRLKERLLNVTIGALLSYHPEIWTANLLAVYKV